MYARIASGDAATVVEIPGIEQAPVETMYHQTFHENPIIVGTAARVPIEKSEYYLGLPLVRPLIDLRKGRLEISPELLSRERDSAPFVARFLDLGYFVVDRAYEKRGVVAFVEEVLPVDRWYEDESLVVLKTRRTELPEDPAILQAGSPYSRQHFESGWLRPESEGEVIFRWADRKRSTILFRRPSPSVRSMTLVVAPLEGIPQSMEIELDGESLPPARAGSGMAGGCDPASRCARSGRGRAAPDPVVAARRRFGARSETTRRAGERGAAPLIMLFSVPIGAGSCWDEL